MSPATIKKLFQPFSQGDEAMMRQFSGTGLGLYITKQLCERMGGDISVLSQEGLGSTFQFYVKLEIPEEKKNTLTAIIQNISIPSLNIPAYNILIAEDNRINQIFLKKMLEKLGCHVDVAENGQEAVEAAFRNKYDFIFMDGEMPVMDGLTATRRLRESFTPEKLPIIGITAHAMSHYRETFLEAGMNAYLTKPVNKNDLVAIIRATIKSEDVKIG